MKWKEGRERKIGEKEGREGGKGKKGKIKQRNERK